MDWLNYHHLLYFWTVAREGSVARAAGKLRLAQPTVSAQVNALEASLGERLFERQGRGLVLTEVGRTAYQYADEIFALDGCAGAYQRGTSCSSATLVKDCKSAGDRCRAQCE